jgi:PAS domain S-box-containing protein
MKDESKTKKQLITELRGVRKRTAKLEKVETERKRIEQVLQESEARYRELFENTKNAVAVYKAVNGGKDFILLDFNKAGEKIENIKKDKIIGKSVFEIFPGIKDLGCSEVFQRVWSTGKSEHHSSNNYKDERLTQWKDSFVYKLPTGEIVVIYSDETERKQAGLLLLKSETKFRALVESTPAAIIIVDEERFLYVNPAFESITGFSKEEARSMTFWDVVHPDMKEIVKKRGLERLKGDAVPSRFELKCLIKNREIRWIDVAATLIDYGGKPAILAAAYDITKRKQAQDSLFQRERQLENQTRDLEEANTALKVLLKHREQDKIELEEKVLVNFKELILPYIEKLKMTDLKSRQKMYLEIVESNLNEIISPFMRNLSSKYQALTPMEIQVAGLVKEGKTTKDIGELLNRSYRAIEFHRNNLRKKIGLTHQKANLRSYLQSLG